MTTLTAHSEAPFLARMAFVWQVISTLPWISWDDIHSITGAIESRKDLIPDQSRAEAIQSRAEFISEMKGREVWTLMGGAGDPAAAMMFWRGATVRRLPPRHLKAARAAATEDTSDPELLMHLSKEKPELFYLMTEQDAKIAELQRLVKMLYRVQRCMRIPLELQLIGMYREQALYDAIKHNQALEDIPTEEELQKVIDHEDEKPAAEEKTPKKKGKKKISPQAATIIAKIKEKIVNDPRLQRAREEEKDLEKQIKKQLKTISEWEHVFDSIDGIGIRTGSTLLAFLVSPERFEGKSLLHSCGQFQAYCGWSFDRSGRAQSGKGRRGEALNHRPEVRRALFNWWSGISKRKKSPWNQWFQRILERQREGWSDVDPNEPRNTQHFPGYAEKRVLKIIDDEAARKRYLTEKNLRARLNKAMREVIGEEEAKQFKRNTVKVNELLWDFLENDSRSQDIWMCVFHPDNWKSHVRKMAMRKLVKYFTMYLYHKWCKHRDLPHDQGILDWVHAELQKGTSE